MVVDRRPQARQRLPVPREAHESHGFAEAGLPPVRFKRQHPAVGGERRGEPAAPAQRVGQPQVRLGVTGVAGGGEGVAVERLAVASAPFVERAHGEVRAGQPGIQADRLFELVESGAGLARAVQSEAEVQPHDGQVGGQSNRLAELLDGLRPVAPRPGPEPEVPMRLRAAQRRVHRRHQGIGQGDDGPRARAVFGPVEIGLRLFEIAETAPGHGERIADGRRAGVEPQRLFQMRDGAGVVALRGGGPAELEQHRRGVGMQGGGAGQRRLGGARPTRIDMDLPQPRQRRQVVGAQPEGALEVLDGLRQPPRASEDVRQIVGPAEVFGGESPRIPETALRFVEELAGHQQLPQPSPGAAAFRGLGAVQRGLRLAELRPHDIVHAVQIGQGDRQQRLGRIALRRRHPETRRTSRGAGVRRARKQTRRDESDRQFPAHRRSPNPATAAGICRPAARAVHRAGSCGTGAPRPSSSVSQRSTGRSVHSSSRPLGQTTRTRRTSASRPRPTSTRGSLAEA